MGLFKNLIHGATSLNPKHFVGSLVDPAGTTIREGRGKDSLPTNAKGYYDPAGVTTPQVIGAPPTHAPKAPTVLPPLGQSAQKAPPLPGMGPPAGMMSSPKMVPSMQDQVMAAASANGPGARRAFKSSSAPAYAVNSAPSQAAMAGPSSIPSMARK